MRWTQLLIISSLSFCCTKIDDDILVEEIGWININNGTVEDCITRVLYEEQFGDDTGIRKHQSMAIAEGFVFCFNYGHQVQVLNIETLEKQQTSLFPEGSHHNNAQFLNFFYENDEFPLLIVSQGDSPPYNNDKCFLVRTLRDDNGFSYSIFSIIHNNLNEACNNGSWLVDCENNKLYLYTLTKGDYSVVDDNSFCIYEFELPDITRGNDSCLTYDDVIRTWEFPYLTLQSGVSKNGYLVFNFEEASLLNITKARYKRCAVVFNPRNGRFEYLLPLNEEMETEGMSIYNDKLYVSFKHGQANQSPESTVFKINEYTLPKILQ